MIILNYNVMDAIPQLRRTSMYHQTHVVSHY